MGRILLTTDYLVPGDAVDRFLRDAGHETVYRPFRGPRQEPERSALFEGIDGAIVSSEPLTARELDAAPQLRVLARSGVGYDSIDVAAAAERGIRVCYAPGTNHHSVAEFALGLMIAAARRLPHNLREVREGRWQRDAGLELRGANVAVVGYGPAGRAFAALAVALGMRVTAVTAHPIEAEPGVRFAGLEEALADADYVSLHSRATAENRHLMGAETLALMKPTAVLINTARGSLVDEAALARAVSGGVIAGAALDVLESEPLPPGSPLRSLDSVLVTSHLGGQTVQARERAGMTAARGVVDVLAGREPEFPVAP